MIFNPALCRRILTGRKTQTRRIVKPGETECRYRKGRSYAIQSGRGKPAQGRLEVLDVREEQLAQLTFKDARAEGFKSRDEFYDYWRELYGDLDLKLAVWVITFRLVQDPPRLLHKDSSRGYTTDPNLALTDEPEAVREDQVKEFTVKARDRDRERREGEKLERQRDSLERRLAQARRDAQARRVDISSNVRVIEKRLQAIEAQLYEQAA